MNNRKLAIVAANTERYLGGYIYGGTTVAIVASGFAPDQLRTVVYGYGPPYVPLRGDVAFNKAVLSAAPVGAKVVFDTRLQGFSSHEEWEKTGPCRWIRAESWEDYWDE